MQETQGQKQESTLSIQKEKRKQEEKRRDNQLVCEHRPPPKWHDSLLNSRSFPCLTNHDFGQTLRQGVGWEGSTSNITWIFIYNRNVIRADNMLHTYREALKILNNWGGIGTSPPARTLVRMPYVVPARDCEGHDSHNLKKKKPCPSHRSVLFACHFSLEMLGWKHRQMQCSYRLRADREAAIPKTLHYYQSNSSKATVLSHVLKAWELHKGTYWAGLLRDTPWNHSWMASI